MSTESSAPSNSGAFSTKRIFLVKTSLDDTLSFLQKQLDELFDFDQRDHNLKVMMIEDLMGDLEECVNLFHHRKYPEAVVTIMNDIMGRALLIATNIAQCTQKNFTHTNDICAICLEEEAQQPVYCLQCLKVVCCKGCMTQLMKHICRENNGGSSQQNVPPVSRTKCQAAACSRKAIMGDSEARRSPVIFPTD
ncbi:unnamed protein product [Bursaphelenchus xylophilus]|uniref:(pine wood nematode) hypothetical protein n=1 Tax=Bursaphelenchus xylophilus TaxID=6326 RepID=A0A811JY99_BURXY|nr:unnamed protein product [Bursaphelenchus xylophilus]CAG9080679.1 unnamed protein product [Bursaphelenchus xylophilus]